jgi:hypothetical protein
MCKVLHKKFNGGAVNKPIGGYLYTKSVAELAI